MGTMAYDGMIVEFEDRVLAHLHVVIMQQFRREESFAMSWMDALSDGDGRSSIWLHPDGNLRFRFAGSRPPKLDLAWLERLTEGATSSRGLVVVNEDGQLVRSLSERLV
jgi:hypothetical protein